LSTSSAVHRTYATPFSVILVDHSYLTGLLFLTQLLPPIPPRALTGGSITAADFTAVASS
jgi:hypothetical protein